MQRSGRHRAPDPLQVEIQRRVAARAPLGFGVFFISLALSTVFEVLRFPERGVLMLSFAAAFTLLLASAWALIRWKVEWTTLVLVALVNVLGVGINAYHVLADASLAMCVWQITALLGASAIILPWGSRHQALASLGALLSFPLHLHQGTADPLTWSAGATYLVVVVSLSVFGASRFSGYLRSGLQLSAVLSEREARLQSYFDLSLVGSAILAADGICREVNDELCQMLGRAREELLGLSWPALVHPSERDECAALVARALSDSTTAQRREMRCMCKDGQLLYAIVSMRGLPGPAGRSDHVMVLVQDVTERKRVESEREQYLARVEAARQQAEDASRAKDQFLATISHELRTPLTAILGWSTLLRRGGLDAEKAAAALAAIERSATTQAQLIDDLLDVSRIVAGKWRMAVRPMEVAPVIEAAADTIVQAADAKGVALNLALPAQPLTVRGDPDRLQQVVWNLLSNAVKFTPGGGRVDVEVESVGPHARITVRDTGEGIPPEFLPQLFQHFRQADSSTTRRHGGLGLGLAIVRMLVELHGGTVRAHSEGKGRGAVFTVELPLLSADASEKVIAARPSSTALRAALEGLHVLVVDDDADAAHVMSSLFASCGAEVRTAYSTADALEVAGQWQPDVLVSDLAMPDEDGCALLQKLRARGGALGEMPAVAVTAYMGSRERVLAAGFETQIVKPFDPLELAAAVERAAVGSARKASSTNRDKPIVH